jgi:hypothetical protein
MHNKVDSSLSMITIKQYFMNFVENKNIHLEGGWGWFVDLESNNLSEKSRSRYPKQIVRYINIPKTIKEESSICSIKSMHDLRDSSMIFEMDEDYFKKSNNNNNGNCKLLGNTIHMFCIFGIFCLIYSCFIL